MLKYVKIMTSKVIIVIFVVQLKYKGMQTQFYNQKEAIQYYGHCWSWICNHKKVVRCWSGNGWIIVSKD